MRKLLAAIGVVALVAALVLGVAGHDRRVELCVSVGLCEDSDLMGAMLVSVQRQQKLIVLTARLVAPVTSVRETTVGPITVASTKQTAIVPATVDYVVDLSRLKREDLSWDEASRILKVRRPPVTAAEPAIDWSKAQIYRDGNFATAITSVSDRLRDDNFQKAPGLFRAQARADDLQLLAGDAADAALATLFRMPLVASGFADAKVEVIRD